jgi:hypothetical protein
MMGWPVYIIIIYDADDDADGVRTSTLLKLVTNVTICTTVIFLTVSYCSV